MTWPYAPPSSDHETVDALYDALAESGSILKPSQFRSVRALLATTDSTVRGLLPANNREALLGGRASLHESGGSAPPSVLSPARGSSEGSRHE